MSEMTNLQQVSLITRTGERFVFRYAIGRDELILEAILDLAEDPMSDFDWFDASILAYHMSVVRRERESQQ